MQCDYPKQKQSVSSLNTVIAKHLMGLFAGNPAPLSAVQPFLARLLASGLFSVCFVVDSVVNWDPDSDLWATAVVMRGTTCPLHCGLGAL